MGGLGNQMFQYAFGYARSKHLSVDLCIDLSALETDSQRNYQLDGFPTIVYKKKYSECMHSLSRRYNEKHFYFDADSIAQGDGTYYVGYWQSEKYFKHIQNEIYSLYKFNNPIDNYSISCLNKILLTNSVSLHVRRGDYITSKAANEILGACGISYYQAATEFFKSKFNNVHFFIFSDDISWVKKNLNFLTREECEFIEYDNGSHDIDELHLMSRCTHHIIANSTFSWWGAWLNCNPEKIVIAPKRWFRSSGYETKDLIPEKWEQL